MWNRLEIFITTIVKEWKIQPVSPTHLYKLFGDICRGAAFAWIVYQAGNFGALAFLGIGAAFLAIWTGATAAGGWALSNELTGKTLDFSLISPTSLASILFSKSVAQIIFEIPSGIVSFVTVLLVARQAPEVANIGVFAFSVILAVICMVIMSVFLSALVVLAGGRGGFFIGIVPFGAVLSGFILPVNNLPLGLEVLARCTPASWAMDSVWLSVTGSASWWSVLWPCLVCVLVSTIWVMVTLNMCKAVEKRIRVLGTLGAY